MSSTAIFSADPVAARRFGGFVFAVCDALLFGALLYLVGTYGAEATGAAAPPAGTLPWLATGCVGLATLLHRLRPTPLLAALACAAAVTLLILFWGQCTALGYSTRVSRHALGIHLLTRVYALHLAGATIALGLGIVRREKTIAQLVLRVLLPFFTAVGIVVCLVLF